MQTFKSFTGLASVSARSLLLSLSAMMALFFVQPADAQKTLDSARKPDSKSSSAAKPKTPLPSVKAWHMTDDYTMADTTVVDTILAEHQVHNPIWRKSVSSVTLGNLGSPAISTFYPALERDPGNVFYNSLKFHTLDEEDFTFYNTVTPYANLTYQKGIPKAEREEFFSVLFTQNANRRLNFGAKMDINAALGRYEAQDADMFKMGFWSSYDGDIYSMQLQAWYQKFEIEESGGLSNDSVVIDPDSYDYDKATDMPVNYVNARNRLATYRLLFAQSLNIGSVTRTEGDSVEYDIPVATAFYKFYIDRSHHEFTIDELKSFPEDIYPERYTNPKATHDSRKYMVVSNLFQLKLNEEFNSLLRFGLRAYVGNLVRQYYNDEESELVYDEETDEETLVTRRRGRNKVSSYIGGQIFKNIGDVLRWNAGVRFVMQGYDAGDLTADGNVSLTLGSGRWQTNVWGKAVYQLRTPTLWEESYTSNHYKWDLHLDREQNLDISAGVRIPGIGFEGSVFSSTLSDRVYFGKDGIPDQKSDVTQLFGVYVREHLHQPNTNLHSIIRFAVQKTSDNDVVPAPKFALTATSYWEHLFFGVLLTQFGVDVRYNTKYYTPAYIPALMQFVPQDERKIGGYGYLDPFINFHLKKIRAYVKYEHVNYYWGSNDYFHTIHYPANPGTFKFGLSWNFYD